MRKRIAALYVVELQDPQAALEAYREVLESGFDAESAAAIRGIGETHDELRGDAADALEPVLDPLARGGEVTRVERPQAFAQRRGEGSVRIVVAFGAREGEMVLIGSRSRFTTGQSVEPKFVQSPKVN